MDQVTESTSTTASLQAQVEAWMGGIGDNIWLDIGRSREHSHETGGYVLRTKSVSLHGFKCLQILPHVTRQGAKAARKGSRESSAALATRAIACVCVSVQWLEGGRTPAETAGKLREALAAALVTEQGDNCLDLQKYLLDDGTVTTQRPTTQ